MVDFTAKFRGTTGLFSRARLLSSNREIERKLRIIALRGEREVKEMITRKGAVDTGRLRASVGFRELSGPRVLIKAGGEVESSEGVTGTGRTSGRATPALSIPVEYAPFVEDRTHFFRDSIPEIRRQAKRVMRQ